MNNSNKNYGSVLIIFGVISSIIGAFLLIMDNSNSRSAERAMEDLFESGNINYGSELTIFGVIFFVIGGMLFLSGLFVCYGNNKNEVSQNFSEPENQHKNNMIDDKTSLVVELRNKDLITEGEFLKIIEDLGFKVAKIKPKEVINVGCNNEIRYCQHCGNKIEPNKDSVLSVE